MTLLSLLACAASGTVFFAAALKHPLRNTAAVAAIALCVVQFLIEGVIIQMIPAYIAALLFAVFAFNRVRASAPLSFLTGGGGLAALAASWGLFWFMPVFELPPPTGAYDVGTRYIKISPPGRAEPFTPDPDDARTLYAQIWYPAAPGPDDRKAPYWSDADDFGKAVASFQSWWQPTFAWMYWHMRLVSAHAYLNAPILEGGDKFPLVIHSHGHPVDPFNSNTALMEDLASRGFVAVALVHPYETPAAIAPDGQTVAYDINNAELGARMLELKSDAYNAQARRFRSAHSIRDGWDIHGKILAAMPALSNSVEIWNDDIADFVSGLQSPAAGQPGIAAATDFERVGVIGFSLGGATATSFCAQNPICKAGVNLDGYLFGDMRGKPLSTPFLFFYSAGNDGMNDFYYRETAGPAYRVSVPGSMHINFTDFSLAGPYLRALNVTGATDGRAFIDIMRAAVGGFFEMHLKTAPDPWCALESQYPHVDWDQRRPDQAPAPDTEPAPEPDNAK